MGEKTKIEYLQPNGKTWSPWFGCSHCSIGCQNCFAEVWAKRTSMVEWGPGKPRRLNKDWNAPLRWDRKAKAAGTRYRILTDLCDPFDEEAPIDWLVNFLSLILHTPNLNWLILTKRIKQFRQRMINAQFWCCRHEDLTGRYITTKILNRTAKLPNIWLGITVCNQSEADRDIPVLLSIPATKHWISYEPALEEVDFLSAAFTGSGSFSAMEGIDWIVAGCESGPKHRYASHAWFRYLRDQCQQAGIPFFLKQMEVGGKVVHLPELDGKVWKEIPVSDEQYSKLGPRQLDEIGDDEP